MKKILLSLLILLLPLLPAMAQTVQKGYYRIRNTTTNRYIFLVGHSCGGDKL